MKTTSSNCTVRVVNDTRGDVPLSVDYTYTVEHDPLGTGDSPCSITIDEFFVEIDGLNVDGLLNDETLAYIEQKVLEDARLEELFED